MNSYYERLIERLHGHYDDYGEGRTQDYYQVCLDCKDAALALDTLMTENARLRDESANYQQVAETLQINGFEDFRAFVDAYKQIKHERDRLKIFYEDIAKEPDCNTCQNKKCTYRPRIGETTRLKCPLWVGTLEE